MKDGWTLLSQGAEARVWKIPGATDDDVSIAKERFAKSYRHPTLDERLTSQRCRAEAKVLAKCLEKRKEKCLWDVPKVIKVDVPILYLEYIQGKTVRALLEEDLLLRLDSDAEVPLSDPLSDLATTIGSSISEMHALGVVHGDLTTSNMMIRESGAVLHNKLTIIDFGLAKHTESAEEKAVDLYVLERALTSTHPNLPLEAFWEKLVQAYQATSSAQTTSTENSKKRRSTQSTLDRLEQVRQRGRKRECFG